MATLNGLRGQVRLMRAKVGTPAGPKHWCFVLIGEQEIPACVRAQFAPRDTVFVRYIHVEFFEDDPDWPGAGYVTLANKVTYIVSMQTGQWTKVTKHI